jgi:hypothetical protein
MKGTLMKPTLQTWRNVAILALLLTNPAGLRADPVIDWNAIAYQTAGTAQRPIPTGVLDVATVQAAVYDAVQAIERKYEPYYVDIPGASGSSAAAAAKAAYDVLVHRFPAQASALAATYQNYLTTHGLSESDPGTAVGAKAAAGIIALRGCDGSFPSTSTPFVGGTAPGVWRPTPPNNQAMLAPWLGSVTPFTLTRPFQFRSEPPPALTSNEYTKDYDEVKAVGAANSTTRTLEQTDIAYFYNGNIPLMFAQTVRDVATAHVDNIADSARLLALTSMSVADALINCWNDKGYYVFWRPITAIREADNDGNASTVGDPNWTSLVPSPPYPDYTSGAVNVATATTRAMQNFFGTDRLTFSVTTTNVNPTVQDTRTYHRLSDAAREVVDARIYLGIHFRFADEAAREQGRSVADWMFRNFLRPLNGSRPQATAPGVAQISTRGLVQTGDNVVIGGFILNAEGDTNILVRAVGPSLTNAAVSGALSDTILELFDGNGVLVARNDDWKSEQEQAIRNTAIPPSDDREAAILRTLSPGSYTSVVRGKGNASGVALVEIYSLE